MSKKNGKLLLTEKTSLKNEDFTYLSPELKKQILLKKAQHYQDNIKEDIRQLRKDLIVAGAVAGAAFLGFKLISSFFPSKKPTVEKEKIKFNPDQFVLVSEKPAKKSSLIWELFTSRIVTFAVDALVTKVLENLPTRKSEDDK